MTIIKLSEAKAALGRYIHKAARGERFVISDRNRPVACLAPLPDAESGVRPKLGLMDGKAHVPDDFDAPLEAFEKDFYGA
jgi:prevent-host-death family protein